MRALDLFSGAVGGWSIGLHRAGVETVAACEVDPWRRAMFAAEFPRARMYDDVRELTAARLVRDLGYLPEIIVGSPPCQDASAANHRGRGVDGERTGLFFEAIRLVDECRPAWCCFENSPRLRTRGFDRLAVAMEAIGYACEAIVVGAEDLLAPHERKRVWLVGYDPDAYGQGQSGVPVDGEMARLVGPSGDAYRQRLALGESIARDACPELAPIVGAVGTLGIAWSGGPAGHRRVAHGAEPGLARPLIAAIGDAVVPQITEAIARACLATFMPSHLQEAA